MNKIVRLAVLATMMFLLPGCTVHVWRTGEYDYDIRTPVGNSPYSFGGTVSWQHVGGGGYSSSGSAPVIGGGAPTVVMPPSPGPAPAAPSKVGGSPAPAYKSR